MSFIALVRETTDITKRDLYWISRGLDVQLREVAADWHRDPMDVVVFDSLDGVPQGVRCWPIVFTHDGERLDQLAVHFPDPWWNAAGRVFTGVASGVFDGDTSVCEAASHEAIEMAIDPPCSLWLDGPRPTGWLGAGGETAEFAWAMEACDPAQTSYSTYVWGLTGRTRVTLSNYVFPEWFDEVLYALEKPVKVDRLGQLSRPFEIGPEGYAIVRRRDTGEVQDVFASAFNADRVRAKRITPRFHPRARTWRRAGR